MSRLRRRQAVATPNTGGGPPAATIAEVGPRYRWIALSNTLIAGLIVSIDSTIVLIAVPSIFRGIRVDPLKAANTKYMLWLILGFLIVTAVLVVSLGRLGDIYGRVRVYSLGFAVFTVFSILLSVTWMHGSAGATWLIVMRIGQGFGGAMLIGNMSAILTDAFPAGQRGTALGIGNIAFVAGATIGLILGGILAPISWRLIFLVSVPVGLIGTVWSYVSLRDIGERHAARIDWWGNLTFAGGLIAVMVAITSGIQPYGHHTMGWTSPTVIAEFGIGFALIAIFALIESRVAEPMLHLRLFSIRAFSAGNLANGLTSLARGGLQFILIIWLQGIWLPEHGYHYSDTPLWSGIHMLPNVAGLLIAGPISGMLSDRFGARPFATAGALLAALSFLLLARLPVDFPYPLFALLLALNGVGMGLFISPNRAAVMNSLPPWRRGVGAGMLNTFQNSASVLSIGIFFSLMIVGLAGQLPSTLYHGFVTHGVAPATAARISHLPPVTTLFATFLGYNPVAHLLGHVLATLSPAQAAALTGRTFFPHLITKPFASALNAAFIFAMIACILAAIASLLRGGKSEWSGGRAAATAEVAVASPNAEREGSGVPERVGVPLEPGLS
jgi:MFS family permease